MPLVLFNDLTGKKEPFVPLQDDHVGFYVCGPTVYDYFHIGNARPFILFDVLRRYMEYRGYQVTYVENFTDIDDKMINRAREKGISVNELAERFIQAYREDAEALGVRPATISPRATEHIEPIIRLIGKILNAGHAYEVDGDVYFSVTSFPEYGKLAKQDLDELQSGARIEVDPRKEHPLDFALWKSEKPGEPAWESPWGRGRPGWHIECSAMSMEYLGDTLDIHAGGSDLIFPHHENEIAQAEAATGQPFVQYWVHNGYLMIDKEKMSKSLGNFMTAREARKVYSPLAIRHFMLSAHYRSPLNFSDEGLQQATSAVNRLRNCWGDLCEALDRNSESRGPDAGLRHAVDAAKTRFLADMDDDFNSAGALGAVYECVRAVNAHLQHSPYDIEGLREALRFLEDVEEIMGVIGIEALNEEGRCDDTYIEQRIAEREQARREKDYARADQIRDELLEQGVVLKDTPDGTRWTHQR
ncbi:MAG: cysteine--tRNA ligase [Synergistales bacterium]|nr:cysteine--tRNA ligase [Synergistales bacterium]